MTISSNKLAANILYFAYTFVFFSLQLKIVVDTFFSKVHTPLELASMLIAFKVGELVNEVFKFGSTRVWIGVSIISVSLYACTSSWFTLIIGFFLFGLSMMRVRDIAISGSSKRVKFAARALGFILAPFVTPIALLIMILSASICCYNFLNLNDKSNKSRLLWFTTPENRFSYLTMGLHHFHYFAYAYTIPLIFQTKSGINTAWVGLLFYVGWAAYNAYEKLIQPSWKYLAIGHFIAGIALFALSQATGIISISTLWFITGLGGGTVYMLHNIIPKKVSQAESEFKIAENIGHLLGIITWSWLLLTERSNLSFHVAGVSGMIVFVMCIYKLILIGNSTSGQDTKNLPKSALKET